MMNAEVRNQLISAAISARESSYSPYSKFSVGAAILGTDGSTYTGCNVENASFGLSICAERNAICQAVAAGKQSFIAIVIAAVPLASPCGACRQFIVEFGDDIEVISVDASNPQNQRIWSSKELIPDGFSFE